MVRQMTNRNLLKCKAETLTETEIAEVLEYISIMEMLHEQASNPDPLDEALVRLLYEAMKGGRISGAFHLFSRASV
jgi:hypothetical protein